jgi:hypothetical protein
MNSFSKLLVLLFKGFDNTLFFENETFKLIDQGIVCRLLFGYSITA